MNDPSRRVNFKRDVDLAMCLFILLRDEFGVPVLIFSNETINFLGGFLK